MNTYLIEQISRFSKLWPQGIERNIRLFALPIESFRYCVPFFPNREIQSVAANGFFNISIQYLKPSERRLWKAQFRVSHHFSKEYKMSAKIKFLTFLPEVHRSKWSRSPHFSCRRWHILDAPHHRHYILVGFNKGKKLNKITDQRTNFFKEIITLFSSKLWSSHNYFGMFRGLLVHWTV